MQQLDTAVHLANREDKCVFLNDAAHSDQQEGKQNVKPELSAASHLPELVVDAFVCRFFVVVSRVLGDCLKLLLRKKVEKDVRDRKSNAQTHCHSPAQAFLVLAEVESDCDECGVAESDQYLQEAKVPAKHAFSHDLLDLKIFKTLEGLDNQEKVE